LGDVLRISEYRNRELISFLEELTIEAKKGEVSGLAFAIVKRDCTHGIGVVGHYRDNPLLASGVIARLFLTLNFRADQLGLTT
jgi:hypothetical protein